MRKIKPYKPKDWDTVKILEPDTGRFSCRYTYKRKKALRVVIETKKSQALSGYILIEKDIRNILIWLSEVKRMLESDEQSRNQKGHIASENRDLFNIIKGLFVASLTFYGKCFTTCEGRKIKLDKKFVEDKFKEKHDEMMDMRHNFAAHSGAKKMEVARVVLALDANKKKMTHPHLAKELYQPDSISLDSVDLFILAIESLQKSVNRKIDTLVDKVFTDDILSKGLDYWYKKTT